MRWSADKTRRERRAWLPKRCGDCGDVIWLEKLVASRDVYGNWTEVKCTVCEVMPRLVGKLSDAQVWPMSYPMGPNPGQIYSGNQYVGQSPPSTGGTNGYSQ